jgi:hypothetical protein
MYEISGLRLGMREVEAADLPGLLLVYLFNPEPVALKEGSQGQPGYFDLEMLQRDWWVAHMMPGRHMLHIYLTCSPRLKPGAARDRRGMAVEARAARQP